MRNVTSLCAYLFLLVFMTRAVKITCPLSFLCLIPGCTRHFSRLRISSMCTTVFTVNIKMKDMLPWEFDKYQGRLASSHARYPGCQTLLNWIQPIFKVLNQILKWIQSKNMIIISVLIFFVELNLEKKLMKMSWIENLSFWLKNILLSFFVWQFLGN